MNEIALPGPSPKSSRHSSPRNCSPLWVRTFPSAFYEELFRLRRLPYASDSVRRPQYFGLLTNDIVYKRLAPGVLDELKNIAERDDDGRPKHKYFQKLTSNVGLPPSFGSIWDPWSLL